MDACIGGDAVFLPRSVSHSCVTPVFLKLLFFFCLFFVSFLLLLKTVFWSWLPSGVHGKTKGGWCPDVHEYL